METLSLSRVGSCRWIPDPRRITSNLSRAFRKASTLFCVKPTKNQRDRGEEIEARPEHIALPDHQESGALWDEAGGIHRPAMRAILSALATRANAIPTANHIAILQLLPEHKVQSWLGKNQTQTLNLDECASLSLLLERLEDRLAKTSTSVLPEVIHRLALLTKAAWAQQARTQAIVQLQVQHKPLERPGTSTETQLGVSLGVTLGQRGMATFSPELALSRDCSLANDDAGYVMQSKEFNTAASIVGAVGLSKTLGASASASASYSQSSYAAYPDAHGYVQLNAHRLARAKRHPGDWSSEIGGGWFRRLRRWNSNELKDYQTLMRQAANQQQRLLLLLSALQAANGKATPALPGPILQQPGFGEVSTIKGQIGATVAATLLTQGQVGLSAGLNTSVQAILIKDKGWTPLWDRLQADAQLNTKEATSAGRTQDQQAAQQRASMLDKKAISLCGTNIHTHPLSRLWHSATRVPSARKNQTFPYWEQADFMPLLPYLPPEILPKMLDSLSAEFDSYCATLQQMDAHGIQFSGAREIEQSLNQSWQGKNREQALANMIICHALLARAALAYLDQKEKQPLDEQIKKLGDKLRSPLVKHDPKQLLQLSAHLNVLTLNIQETNFNINLNSHALNLACNLALSVTKRKRVDYNPARAGEYIDLVLSANGSASIPTEALKNALSAALQTAGLSAELNALLPQALSLDSSTEIGIGHSTLWRFFKPSYQQAANYPEQHRGFRLLTQRELGTTSFSSGLKLDIPLTPGISLKPGFSRARNQATVLRERFGDNSLSMAMMLFFKLKDCQQTDRWEQLCQQQKASLDRLFRNLARPNSAVHAEANYLASIQEGVDTDHLFNAMNSYAQQPETEIFIHAQEAFNLFLQQLYPLYQASQANTPLIQGAKLDFDSWAWPDQEERRANTQWNRKPGVTRRQGNG